MSAAIILLYNVTLQKDNLAQDTKGMSAAIILLYNVTLQKNNLAQDTRGMSAAIILLYNLRSRLWLFSIVPFAPFACSHINLYIYHTNYHALICVCYT